MYTNILNEKIKSMDRRVSVMIGVSCTIPCCSARYGKRNVTSDPLEISYLRLRTGHLDLWWLIHCRLANIRRLKSRWPSNLPVYISHSHLPYYPHFTPLLSPVLSSHLESRPSTPGTLTGCFDRCPKRGQQSDPSHQRSGSVTGKGVDTLPTRDCTVEYPTLSITEFFL